MRHNRLNETAESRTPDNTPWRHKELQDGQDHTAESHEDSIQYLKVKEEEIIILKIQITGHMLSYNS